MTYEEIETKAYQAYEMGLIKHEDIEKYIRHLCEKYNVAYK